ncbi:hypothetical protein FEFB_16380 [Fructobacillus sp. EFB-N1]|uniref:hypothetical protein n=1 Tax=Fructobacillus sp. EFB-N1 TaxID=1658766 RepID=UPI00065D1A78|nr:hypothetical protein [Fructobacillus sp. EFB-N1]KMK52629.1 hypothetical protein FEFB_16380 [Fructobacillus sp. EFB-N1]
MKDVFGKFNLKKLGATDIVNDPGFSQLIDNNFFYLNVIQNNMFEDILTGNKFIKDMYLDNIFSWRVKSKESIQAKIEWNFEKEKSTNKIPVIKWLNDTFGMRIIVSDTISDDELIKMLEDCKCKCTMRYYLKKYPKTGPTLKYQAIHCYFKENNKTFPWELQIWKESNAKMNIFSHTEHEQAKRDKITI